MKLNTGISPNYVKGWDVTKALRELLQNNLDSRQDFDCFGRIVWRNGFARIIDSGPGLEMKHLALGISEKSGTAKGQFGEGLKLALLLLAREGREVEIQTRGSIIRPTIEFNEAYGTDLLVLNVEEAPKVDGTIIRVHCSQRELDRAKAYFVEFEEKEEGFHWLEKDKISTPGGFIYINGTRVGKLEGAKFSYHLSGKMDIGNRDREVIDSNKVRPFIRQILRDTTSHTVLGELFRAATRRDSGLTEIQIGIDLDAPDSSVKRWKLALQRNFSFSKTLISEGNSEDNHYVEELGYEVVTIWEYSWEYVMKRAGMKPVSQVARGAKATNVGRVGMQKLSEIEDANLRKAKRLVKKHYKPAGSVRVIEKAKGLAADDKDLGGYYDPASDKIYIIRKTLIDERETLHTLLHETVHKHTGFSDNTREFERALLDVAVGIIMRGGKKVGWE